MIKKRGKGFPGIVYIIRHEEQSDNDWFEAKAFMVDLDLTTEPQNVATYKLQEVRQGQLTTSILTVSTK